jgi:hypothetical protein
MAECFRCEVVTNGAGAGAGVGACLECGAFACREDGDRDSVNLDFICGMCQPSRLMASVLPRPPEDPGGPTSESSSPEDPSGGSGGSAAVPFASTPDYESRCPNVAASSAQHRHGFRDQMEALLGRLREQAVGETAQALAGVSAVELDPEEVAVTVRLLWFQVAEAMERGEFDPDLRADTFGVAAWSIGVEVGREPDKRRLDLLADKRLQVALARLQQMYA